MNRTSKPQFSSSVAYSQALGYQDRFPQVGQDADPSTRAWSNVLCILPIFPSHRTPRQTVRPGKRVAHALSDLGGFVNPVQRCIRKHGVEFRSKGQFPGITNFKFGRRASRGDHLRRAVNAHNLSAGIGNLRGQMARAASQIEDAPADRGARSETTSEPCFQTNACFASYKFAFQSELTILWTCSKTSDGFFIAFSSRANVIAGDSNRCHVRTAKHRTHTALPQARRTPPFPCAGY